MTRLAACDSSLQLGYGYNGEDIDIEFHKFDLAPPAFGYTLIQGPITTSNDPSDYAFFGFRKRWGFANLPMTSFWQKAVGTAVSIDSWGRDQKYKAIYKVMKGYLPLKTRNAVFYDCNKEPTKFMVNGDPVEETGCIDGMNHVHPGCPGNRRFQMNSGPFSMALGDTQEVIIAMVGGIGSDHLASVSVMKHYVKLAQCWAQAVFKTGFEHISVEESPTEALPENFRLYQNYPNPFNSGTELCYDLPLKKNVKLTIYNLLGQMVKVLVNETQAADSYAYKWDGTDFHGERVPTGIYLYKIEAGYWTKTEKMMLLR